MDQEQLQAKPAKFSMVNSKRDFNLLVNRNFGKIIVLYFFAEWNDESIELKDLLLEYLDSYDLNAIFGFINSDTEELSYLCEEFKIDTVPSCLLIDSDKNILHSFESINPGEIFQTIEEQTIVYRKNFELEKVKMFTKIESLLKQNPVVVFLKGTEKNPECGFSRKTLEFLNNKNIIFKDQNVFENSYRHWIKEFSGFQTIPQVYIDSKFVGGLDTINDLDSQGKFDALVPKGSTRDKPSEILDKILEDSRLIFFRTSDNSNKDFWKKCMTVQTMLGQQGMLFSMFDLKTYPDLAAELFKKGSEVLPQLWLEGSHWASGDALIEKLSTNSNESKLFHETLYMKNIEDYLKALVNKSPVMLFIKGTPDFPQCGFSNTLLTVFDQQKVEYGHFNILADPLVREKLKGYSQWNTYPQVWIDGELVGGLDIVKELIENGEFQEMVQNYLKK